MTGMDSQADRLIPTRKSCRSFLPSPLRPEHRAAIETFIAHEADCPVPGHTTDGATRIVIVDRSTPGDQNEPVKLGTYGMIRGAKTFIAGITADRHDSLVAIGYRLERIILFAESLGLGTCWLGGTFTRESFGRAAGVGPDEILPCIIAIGYPARRRTVIDTFVRASAGSRSRKFPEQLFHTYAPPAGGTGVKELTPIDLAAFGTYGVALEMVRLAPSASNRQPWRVFFEPRDRAAEPWEGTYNFFMSRSKRYVGNKLGFTIQRIDMGIAAAHFGATCLQYGIEGEWVVKRPDWEPSDEPGDVMEYIFSWVTR